MPRTLPWETQCSMQKFALGKEPPPTSPSPLLLLAAHLRRSLAQAPKARTRESVLHNAHKLRARGPFPAPVYRVC
jgi:hypothetical protein